MTISTQAWTAAPECSIMEACSFNRLGRFIRELRYGSLQVHKLGEENERTVYRAQGVALPSRLTVIPTVWDSNLAHNYGLPM